MVMDEDRFRQIEYLDISIVDRDIDFLSSMVCFLQALGVENLHCGSSVKYAEQLIRRPGADIVFLEYDRRYLSIWEYVRTTPSLQLVVIAMTQRRDTRDSLLAVHSGAERVIAKSQARWIVEPMLVHLLRSDVARRFRVVPFPGTL